MEEEAFQSSVLVHRMSGISLKVETLMHEKRSKRVYIILMMCPWRLKVLGLWCPRDVR